jgi:dTDP-4-dehydrorhamnose reductase
MKTIVIGANGQLGSDIVEVFGKNNVIPLTHSDIEITDTDSVSRVFKKFKPDKVINVAALSNVPECEKNPKKAFEVNALGIRNLAIACKEVEATFLHISTDYVFDGEKSTPYIEDDLPNPLNVYGITKLAGEYFVKAILEKYFIVRTSGLYGKYLCRSKGSNFIDKMIAMSEKQEEVRVVSDEVLTPTYTRDLAIKIRELIERDNHGMYHITNSGGCSWHEFAQAIFSFLKTDVKLVKIEQKEFPSLVKRPKYSVLSNEKLKTIGINSLRPWQEALKDYLREKSYSI